MANLPDNLIFNGIDLQEMTVDEAHIFLNVSINKSHNPYLYRCVILIQYKHRFVVDIIADRVDTVIYFLNNIFSNNNDTYIFEAAKNKKMNIPVQYYKNGIVQAAIHRMSQLQYVYSMYRDNKPNKIIVKCSNCKNTYEDDGFVIKNCVCKHCHGDIAFRFR